MVQEQSEKLGGHFRTKEKSGGVEVSSKSGSLCSFHTPIPTLCVYVCEVINARLANVGFTLSSTGCWMTTQSSGWGLAQWAKPLLCKFKSPAATEKLCRCGKSISNPSPWQGRQSIPRASQPD